jgi:thiaminase/transcriptional activator TenA
MSYEQSLPSSSPTMPVVPPSLSERLRQRVLPLWQQQFMHPFVVALGNGTLPRANFEFYIRQDALFLDELTRTFGYAATKTSHHDEMEQFGHYLLNTLLVERDLHRRYGEKFGLTPQQMAATPMAPTNYAYTRHLLHIAATGTLPELLTAILPCAWIYAEVGTHLVRDGVPGPEHPYADWLALYASPDFDAVEKWLRACLDRYRVDIRPAEEERLHQIFLVSTRYEWMFWEMAWKQETWPL